MGIYYSKSAERCNFVHAATLRTNSYLKERCNVEFLTVTMDRIIGIEDIADYSELACDPNSELECDITFFAVLDKISEHYFGHPWPDEDIGDCSLFWNELTRSANDEFNTVCRSS
jgi:hypothetical protein